MGHLIVGVLLKLVLYPVQALIVSFSSQAPLRRPALYPVSRDSYPVVGRLSNPA